MNEQMEPLLAFIKALSDANRLKLVGLLAQKEASVEELAAMLDISASTTSHHLSILSEIGLVSARADGYYNMYRLETDALEEMAQTLLAREKLPEVVKDIDPQAYEHKILKDYLASDGTITKIPNNRHKLDVILAYIADKFELDKVYTEKEVNQVIGALNPDISGLRRDLISSGILGREKDGSAYWRVKEAE